MFFDNILKLLFNTLSLNLRNNHMNPNEAINIEKNGLLELFAEENPKSIRFEEIEVRSRSDLAVTLSYLRHGDPYGEESRGGIMSIAAALSSSSRVFKKFIIDSDTGYIKAIKNEYHG